MFANVFAFNLVICHLRMFFAFNLVICHFLKVTINLSVNIDQWRFRHSKTLESSAEMFIQSCKDQHFTLLRLFRHVETNLQSKSCSRISTVSRPLCLFYTQMIKSLKTSFGRVTND